MTNVLELSDWLDEGRACRSRWMDIAIYRRDTRPDIGDRWLAIGGDDNLVERGEDGQFHPIRPKE